MAKVSFAANELRETDVSLISMVRKGANRIPFRILKEDNEDMLDLSDIKSAFKKADKTPGVCAVVVMKNDNYDANLKLLKAAGFKIDGGKEDDEGLVLIKQDGVTEFDTAVMKINEDVGLVVSGLKKAFSSWDNNATSFTEVVKTAGFFPSVRMATEAFMDTVHNAMAVAENPSDATSTLTKAADELRDYIAGITSVLPVRAFKADNAAAVLRKGETTINVENGDTKVEPTAEEKPEETEEETTEEETSEEDQTDENAEAEAVEKSAGKGKGANKKKPGGKVPEDKSKAQTGDGKTFDKNIKKSDTETPDFAALLKSSLTEALGSFGKDIDKKFATMKTDIDGRLDKVAEQARKADEAINGTTDSEAHDDPHQVRKSAEKSKGVPPLMDTAYTS